MQCRYNECINLVQYKNYWNNTEKPQQNTVLKNHCEKTLGNATAKPKTETKNLKPKPKPKTLLQLAEVHIFCMNTLKYS